MQLFDHGESLGEDERALRLATLEHDLAEVEIRRRFLHERIDLLRAEHVRRLGELRRSDLLEPVAGMQPQPRRLFTGTGTMSTEPLGGLPDVATLPDDELRTLTRFLKALEDDVSLERRVLHARIDELRPA